MRPAKEVLVYCNDATVMSTTAVMLRIQGFKVTTARCPVRLAERLTEWNGHAAVVIEGKEADHCESVVKKIQADRTAKVGLVLAGAEKVTTTAHECINGQNSSNIASMVKDLVAVKRGPKVVVK